MSEHTPHPEDQHRPGPVPPGSSAPAPKRLVRPRNDRMVAGVCSGVADYLGVDVTLVRIVTVVATVLGFGSVVLVYLLAWLLVPEA